AEIPAQSLLDLFRSRARSLSQQRRRSQDHSVGAISALRGLFCDERRLYFVRSLQRAQTLECRDGASLNLLHRNRAGSDCLAVEQYGAGAALSEAAAEFHGVQR